LAPISCIVPARLASNRFPGKLLHPLLGTPLIVHTLRRAREADCFDEILCLTDARVIRDAAEEAGFTAVLSGPAANGTDRIGKYADLIRNDLIVNLQGDEPAFEPEALRLLARALGREPGKVHILVEDRPPSPSDLANPNRCKAGLDATGHVLDFFRRTPRAAIAEARLQSGAYAYGKGFLRRYAEIAPSEAEVYESHEMLRDLGLAPIRAHACPWRSQSVDVPADADLALALLMGLSDAGASSGAVAASPVRL
jgi:3-deoxy-manno-octulosonate cytidylyltransferase (CMP-KDO synthetase)